MMKKMTGLAAILLATLMIAAPLTADAGFNIGGVLNKIPGVSVDKGKTPSVPSKTGGGTNGAGETIEKNADRPMAGTVLANGAPAQHFGVYVGGPGVKVEVVNNTVVIHGETHSEGATDNNGSLKELVVPNGKTYTFIIWSAGYDPIVKYNVTAPSDLGRMTTSSSGVKFIDFRNY